MQARTAYSCKLSRPEMEHLMTRGSKQQITVPVLGFHEPGHLQGCPLLSLLMGHLTECPLTNT